MLIKIQAFCIIIFFSLLLNTSEVFAQSVSGSTLAANSHTPVAYVNIGVKNKNIGTVSDQNGKFSLDIAQLNSTDSITFSCIGYKTRLLQVQSLLASNNNNILLDELVVQIQEVVVNPTSFVYKTLGVETAMKKMSAGFEENKLGYEFGILMKSKKLAIPEKLILNIASCSYDSVFYRVNVYEVDDDNNFTNILNTPIYFSFSKNNIGDKIEIDLAQYQIVVNGNFLVSVEHVKDLGSGHLYFCAMPGKRTYFRKTSHGEWDSAPIGVSISVLARVEK